MTNSITIPSPSQDPSTLERAYYEQFASWETADYFAEGAQHWLIRRGITPIRMIADSETTCSAIVTIQQHIDIGKMSPFATLQGYVVVDHEYLDIYLGHVEIYIWSFAETFAYYMQGGQS